MICAACKIGRHDHCGRQVSQSKSYNCACQTCWPGPVSIPGFLEIDVSRGVIYFHVSDMDMVRKLGLVTLLRICQLPKPIPEDVQLDITHMVGCSWRPK